jgi:hypothetical protein
MTRPLRIKVTVSEQSCRFTQVVLQSQVQATLARHCSGGPIAGVAESNRATSKVSAVALSEAGSLRCVPA